MGFGKFLKKAAKFTPYGQMYNAGRAATGNKGALNDLLKGGAGGPIGMMMGQRMGDARQQQMAGQNLANASSEGRTVPKAMPGGMANFYDDSWGQLQQGLQGGQGAEDVLGNLLANFKGKPGDLEDFLARAAPFLGAASANQMKGTDAFKFMQDQNNWDLGAMGSYGPAAGMMGQQAARAQQGGANQLAAMGLGRSSVRASQQMLGQQQNAQGQADLWSRVYQQAAQNRMQSAGNALDAHRLVAQMALGQAPTPRMQDSSGGGGGIGGILSGIAGGAGAGAAVGGPVGALIGGLGFGTAAATQRR